MKIRAFLNFSAGLFVLGVIAFGLGSCSKATAPVAESQSSDTTELAAAETNDNDAPMEPLISAASVHETQAQEIVVPTNLKPSDAVADVIKLVNAGNDEALLLAFVTNSRAPFKCGAEELIYLSDIGVPPSVLTAMLQHDHMLPADNVTMLDGADDTLSVANGTDIADTQAATYTAPDFLPIEPAVWPGQTLPASARQNPGPQPLAMSDSLPGEDAAPEFHDTLAPYGTWLDVDGYGECWQPTVAAVNSDWCPYADRGHWSYTDCGWYWASDYTWGWAPFHYGRWFQHASLGWCWVPGRVWSSAWVCWRQGTDVCGWAPLPPGARVNDGLRYHGLPVKPAFHFNLAAEQFHFVPTSQITSRHPLLHAIPRERVKTIFPHTVANTSFASVDSRLANDGIRPASAASARRPIPAPALRPTSATHAPLTQVVTLPQSPTSHSAAATTSTSAQPATTPISTVVSIGSSHRDEPAPSQQITAPAFVPLEFAVARNHPRPAMQHGQPATTTLLASQSLSATPQPQPTTETIVLPNPHTTPHHNQEQQQVMVNQPVQVPWWIATPTPRNDSPSSPHPNDDNQSVHHGRQPAHSSQSTPASYTPATSAQPVYGNTSAPQPIHEHSSESHHQPFSPHNSDTPTHTHHESASAHQPAAPPVQHEAPAHHEQVHAANEAPAATSSSHSSASSSESHSSSSDNSGHHR
jgi:hypothetical protein